MRTHGQADGGGSEAWPRSGTSTQEGAGEREPLSSLPEFPLGFAHRGAPATREQENTLGAFEHALSLGATALETDIGLSATGVPILTHPSGSIGLRRGDRQELHRAPSLEDLYRQCGNGFDLSLDMTQPLAVDAVVRIAGEYGAIDRLWLTYWKLPTLLEWRTKWPGIKLVYPTIRVLPHSAARLISTLSAASIDAVNIHHLFCHRYPVTARASGVRTFAWGIKRRRSLQRALDHGVDGVYCDNLADMVDLLRR